jgi:hypothetical protein
VVGLDSSAACLRDEKRREIKRAGQGFDGVWDGGGKCRGE